LPTGDSLVRDQLVIHSDFDLPERHRLVEELVARRHDVATQLQLPISDEPIHVYLFDTAETYQAFMSQRFPAFPFRRAYFVESDTRLTVYAYWGDRVAEDLRHEVTHGYLHTMVPHLPLWLDEGLAEYYEVPRGSRGLNQDHLQLLVRAMQLHSWAPNLASLEQLQSSGEMTQQQYAEAWAWIHWLLQTDPLRRDLLRAHLAHTRAVGSAPPLSQVLHQSEPLCHRALVEHLMDLHRESAGVTRPAQSP
jgi:hypothetical protein